MKRLALIPLLGWLLPALASAQSDVAPPGEVRLSLARFEALMAAAERRTGPVPTWGRGSVRVALPAAPAGVARVEIEAEVRLVGDGVGDVPLLPAEVALEEVRVGGVAATLVARGGAHTVLVEPSLRVFPVYLRYVAPVRTAADGGSFALLPLPPLPGAALNVEGGTPDAGLDVWPGSDVMRQGGALQAVLPATAAAVLRWGAEVGVSRVRRADYSLVVREDIDAADVQATFDVWLAAPQAQVRLVPRAAALMDLRENKDGLPAEVVGDWHVATLRGVGRHTVQAAFRLPVDRSQGQPQALLALTGAPIAQVAAEVPGKRDVRFEPSVPLDQRVTGSDASARTRVVGFLPPFDQVVIRWTEARPSEERLVRVNTDTYQLVTLQEGVMRSKVTVRYQVIRGKTKELAIQLPKEGVLYKVTGEGIEDWRTFAETGDEPRQVRVTLGREIEGDYTLQLELETVTPKEEGARLDIPIVRPLDVFRQTGVVALFDGDKVGFAPAEQTQYTKVGEDALPVDIRQSLTERVSQAFKHIGEPGPVTSKVAAAKTREVRFDARVNALYHVKEGALVGYASILIDLKSGRQDVVQLSFPKGVNVLDVTAPSLNKHEAATVQGVGPERKGYEIRFTRALEGAIQIDVEFEQLLAKELGKFALPDVRVHGAEVEEGSFGVVADPGIEVQPGEAGDLRQVPVSELPKAVRLRSPREVLLGYRYARAPWSLNVDVKRHRTVETLKAVVQAAWLTSAVLPDGHLVTRALYQVRNDDRQFLRLAMPAGHKVWTVVAAGEKVKAVADDKGALAIPLPKDRTLLVEVVYEVPTDKFRAYGSVTLTAPHADLVVTGLQWLVTTPQSFALFGIDTELTESRLGVFSPPDGSAGRAALPIDTSGAGPMRESLFTRAVLDPTEATPTIAFHLVATPAPWVGWLVWLGGLLLLVPVARRVAGRRPLRRGGVLLLAAGLLLLVAKMAVWDLHVAEGALAALVLFGVALGTAIVQRRRGARA